MIVDTVISYCTVDDMFIRENIRQCLFFSKDIYIIVSSHFFDGTPEDETKVGALKEYCKQFTNVHLIRFRWDNTKSTSYWHSYMRWVGVQQCNTEYRFFQISLCGGRILENPYSEPKQTNKHINSLEVLL